MTSRSIAELDVLVVEDDAALRRVVEVSFDQQGWVVRAIGDGELALAECASRLPDIVVLDIMLPGRSGLEVCTALRALYNPSPGVVMVTARDGEIDVVLGLEVGADDYVIKPFRPKELVARVKALSRRVRASAGAGGHVSPSSPALPSEEETSQAIRRGSLEIVLAQREARIAGHKLRLTVTEFELLVMLARAPNRAYTRMEILREVFGSTHEAYARNVDCHVTRLRRKLEAAGLGPAAIQTVHGYGYSFAAPKPSA